MTVDINVDLPMLPSDDEGEVVDNNQYDHINIDEHDDGDISTNIGMSDTGNNILILVILISILNNWERCQSTAKESH